MEFGVNKCAVLTMKRGRKVESSCVPLPSGDTVRVHVLPFIFDYVIMCKILSLCLRWFRFFVVTHIYIIASSNPHSCCHHSFVSSNYRVSVNMGVLSL